MISDCFCSYVPMFGETEYDPTRHFCSIPIDKQLDALGRAVDSGKIRYGVMRFVQVAERGTHHPKIVSVQNSYSLVCRTSDSPWGRTSYLNILGVCMHAWVYACLGYIAIAGKYSVHPISRLVYTNGGDAILVLASNAILWKWPKDLNSGGAATPKVHPNLWKPRSG
ncbi:unnamed protein product [Prunus armeniaca]|uniref:Uncharacterized protein n=1 Tax=Prunus armeniaca TaxID=36596 RepID=A0A6J5Y2Q0_PRUAR|nr:unnamed protein product [Prunus armeniaca]